MVFFQLQIKAKMQDVNLLGPTNSGFLYFFRVECTYCQQQSEKYACLQRSDRVMRYRCKGCGRRGRIEMMMRGRALTLEESYLGLSAPIMTFDCDGFEPLDFLIPNIWQAVLERNGEVIEVTLSEGIFSVDDGIDSLAVYDLEASFYPVRL